MQKVVIKRENSYMFVIQVTGPDGLFLVAKYLKLGLDFQKTTSVLNQTRGSK